MSDFGLKLKLSIGLLFFTIALVLFSLRSDAATPPSVISYQGKILQNGVSASTSLTMTFELFNTSTGGSALYTYTEAIVPSSGLFSVLIGDSLINPLDPEIFKNNNELYLQVTVGIETLSPRKRIVTVPYAFNAKYLDGYGVSLTPTNTNYIPVADSDGGFTFGNVTTTGDLYVSGTVRVGDICSKDGSFCFNVNDLNITVKEMRTTSVKYIGNVTTTPSLRGYQAANAICNAFWSGSHFCKTEEIMTIIEKQNINYFSGTAWLANGPPGYTAPANDCSGWTSSDGNRYGAIWQFNSDGGGSGYLTTCNQPLPLACCK
jgi:hypothetical protein